MARSAGLTGTVSIGEIGATPTILEAVSFTAAGTTLEVRGRLDVGASSGDTILALAGLTTVSFMKITCTDKSTGDPKDITLTLNDAAAGHTASDFINVAAAGGITKIEYATGAGNNTIITYILAGV